MRIGHLTSVHPPDDTRIYQKEAATLARAGHDVFLIAPAGDMAVDGPVPVFPVARARSRLRRFLLTGFQVYLEARKRSADIYHLHDPELLPYGLLLRRSGHAVVYDAHENLAAQIQSKSWVPWVLRPVVARISRAVECALAKRMSALIAAEGEILEALDPPARLPVSVVHNYPILEEFAEPGFDADPQRYSSGRIVNFGGVTSLRAAGAIVRALAALPPDSGLRLTFGGRVLSPSLFARLREDVGWHRVDFVGPIPRARMLRHLRDAAAAIVLYSRAPNHMQVRSNRLFESMAAGLPVIVPDFAEWSSFIARHRCGLVVDPADPTAIRQALEDITADPGRACEMGQRGRHAVFALYNWEGEGNRLVNMYASLRPEA